MPTKKTYRKSARKNKNSSAMSKRQIEKIALKAVQRKAETKLFPKENQNLTIGPDDQGYVIRDIDNPVQGTDNENRIGDSIQGIGLQVKYNLGSTNANRDYFVRVVMVQARQDDYNDATDNWLLNTANEPIALTGNSLQDIQRSINKKEIQKVLYDKVHKLGKTGSGNTTSFLYRNLFFKLNNKRTFPSDTNDESENMNFRILFVVRDAQGGTVAADNDIQATVYTRYYYKDY